MQGAARRFLFFFFTLVTGPRRSVSIKLNDTRVYEPQIRARWQGRKYAGRCATRSSSHPPSCSPPVEWYPLSLSLARSLSRARFISLSLPLSLSLSLCLALSLSLPLCLSPEPTPLHETQQSVSHAPRTARHDRIQWSGTRPLQTEREFFIDNLLVRIHFIIMIWWTGLAPWEFEFLFSGSLTSTFLET